MKSVEKKFLEVSIVFCLFLLLGSSNRTAPKIHVNSHFSKYEKQVDSLLSLMTLDEKIGQMTLIDMTALNDPRNLIKYHIGAMLNGGNSEPKDISAVGWANMHDKYQSFAMKTRLKIPLIYGIDAVHGDNHVRGAVIFPHNIGLGCTRDSGLVEKAERVTAEEVAGTGIDWTFAPCIAVALNERWGRTYESFGDNTELVAELGSAAIKGFQGANLSSTTTILACAKHYIGDGGTVNGKDEGNTICSEKTLRRLFLPPYKAAIDVGVGSIMISYSSWDGIKMSVNKYLLTKVLKGELGFRGFLVSDWAAINQVGNNYKDDIERSINAGLDMIMVPYGPDSTNNYVEFIHDLRSLVEQGKIPESRINDAVRRILRIKFSLGLFKHPYANRSLTVSVGSEEHREVARQCVKESLVLLKNEHRLLPLSKNLKEIFVAGKSADNIGNQCGGWTIDWQGRSGNITTGGTTILEGIREAVCPATRVVYSKNGSGANGADVGIVVVGETPYAEAAGDRKNLSLYKEDIRTITRVKSAGIPVVVILISGRPLIINKVLNESNAFIAAWLPGTEGEGVSDVLFGDYNPTGRLSRFWPKNMNQVRNYYSNKLAKKNNFTPLFPYGYGLSYEGFAQK